MAMRSIDRWWMVRRYCRRAPAPTRRCAAPPAATGAAATARAV